jgi:hypothetical protein
MKRIFWIFLSGVLVGVAGLFLTQIAFPEIAGDEREGTAAKVIQSSDRRLANSEIGRSREVLRGSGTARNGGRQVTDFLAFLREAKGLGERNGAPNYLTSIRYWNGITNMNEAEVMALIAELESLEEEHGDNDLTGISKGYAFMRWCEVNGSAAMAWFANDDRSRGSVGGRFVRQGMKAWTEADPEGALKWVKSHLATVEEELASISAGSKLSDPLRALNDRRIVETFVEDYCQTTGAKPLDLLEQLAQEGRGAYTRNKVLLVASGNENSPERLKELIGETVTGDAEAQRQIIRNLARIDPQSAGEWSAAQEGGAHREWLVKTVASEWLERNPEEASSWYLKQDVEESRADRLAQSYEAWVKKNPESAMNWLLSQPDDPSRDVAESLAARNSAKQGTYVEAIAWVVGIEDDGLRQERLQDLVESARHRTTKDLPQELLDAAAQSGLEVGR